MSSHLVLPPTFIAVPVLCAAVAAFVYRYCIARPLPGIPHEPYHWFFGHLKEILEADRSGLGSTQLASRHALRSGPVSQMILGPLKNLVLLTDPQEADNVLKRRMNDFEHSENFIVSFGWTIPKSQLALPEGPMWRSHRRLMGPSMSPTYLKLMSRRIGSNVSSLIDLWEKKRALLESSSGAAFEAALDIQLFTMDSIGDITFAESFGGMGTALELVKRSSSAPQVDSRNAVVFEYPVNPQHQAVRNLFKIVGVALQSPSPKLSYYLWGFWNPAWRASRHFLRTFLQQKIDDQRAAMAAKRSNADSTAEFVESADSVLEMVFEREGKDSPETMPDDELIDELALFLLAGQDTTAATLAWGFKYLAMYPRVQKKLHEELVQAYDITTPRILSFDEVQSGSSPYLDAVVYEIMRIAGVAPMASRQAKHDTHLLGHFIPKGTEVLVMNAHISIHDTVENAAKEAAQNPLREKESRATPPWKDDGTIFLPERWIDEQGKFNPRAGSMYAFSAGLRACFGQKLALLQLKITLSAISLAFFFDKMPCPELEGWEAIEQVVRLPRESWVVLRKWETIE